jgi:hypothetical protein
LVACEFDRPCGPRLGPPRRHAVLTHMRQPLADRRWRHTKRFGNLTLFPPVLLELKRPLATCLLSGLGKSMSSVHVRMLAHGKITLRMQRSVSCCLEIIAVHPLSCDRLAFPAPELIQDRGPPPIGVSASMGQQVTACTIHRWPRVAGSPQTLVARPRRSCPLPPQQSLSVHCPPVNRRRGVEHAPTLASTLSKPVPSGEHGLSGHSWLG